MEQTLEERIKQLERELAVKNAYLSVQFTFPKNNKLPEDVKEQVINELKNACAKLAEDQGSKDVKTNQIERLTDDEIKILRAVVESVKAKSAAPVSQRPSVPATMPLTQPSSTDATSVAKEAVLVTLENVPQQFRNKMSSNEKVFVRSEKNGKSFIINQRGQGMFVPTEDLEIQGA